MAPISRRRRKVIIDAVRTVEGVLLDRPVEALFLEFGNSSLIFRVRWWLESYVDTRRMFDSVNTASLQGFERCGYRDPLPAEGCHAQGTARSTDLKGIIHHCLALLPMTWIERTGEFVSPFCS